MKNIIGAIGEEVLEQGGSLVKQTAQSIAQTPGQVVKAGAAQVGLTHASANQSSSQPQETLKESTSTHTQSPESEEFIKKLYGSSPQYPEQKENPQEKKHDEEQKIQELRQEFHKEEYYDPVFNKPQQQEERPAEKIEREEQEQKQKEMMELQEQEKKDAPIALTRAQQSTERHRGASG